ncbi:POTRA domain-containing protein [Leptolyngbya ectocarpi]|uniref:POTRA domain-containing protein n=1 Tax=Leptolyngbya ectocarpi TaxID=1202 RepID=UPI001D153881|nr:POTRA domain-containing protein [Leptolyngbya ectocarpi]
MSYQFVSTVGTACLLWLTDVSSSQAQVPSVELPPFQDTVAPQPEARPEPELLEELPPADTLLGPLQSPEVEPSFPLEGTTFAIKKFEFINNTAFETEELAEVTAGFLGESQTFADIAAAREAVTQLYIENGYATSGAIVPPQKILEGVVTIEIVEGQVSNIVVTGTRRLAPGYISSRIALGTDVPLNVNDLIERLQLLQLDPSNSKFKRHQFIQK